MPVGLAQPLPSDLEGQDEAAASLPFPQGDRFGAAADFMHMGNIAGHLVFNAFRGEAISQADPTGATDPMHPGPVLQSEEANARYGVDGYKRFNETVTEDDAAWQSAQATERRYRDTVLARTRPTPLRDLGAGLVGSLTDPVGLGVMAATGGAGEAALGVVGLGEAAETGMAVSKLGRVWNAGRGAAFQAAKGAAFNAPYVGLNAALSNYAGDDYSLGDGLRDIAAGAILHTGLHYGSQALDALLGRFGRPAGAAEDTPADHPAGIPPEAVQALPPESRAGALAMALDDAADDRPVDVGQYVQREIEANGMAAVADGAGPAPLRPPGDSVVTEPAFHGTDANFEQFDPTLGDTPGSWFSADEAAAGAFGAVRPYDLDIRNPGTLQDLANARRAVVKSGIDPDVDRQRFNAAVIRALEDKGFDGLRSTTHKGAGGKTVFAAFRPDQIREAAHAAREPNQAEATMRNLGEKYARGDPGKIDLRAPGKAAEPPPAKPVPMDLRDTELEKPAKPGAKAGDGAAAEAPEKAAKSKRVTGDQIIAADPELKALSEDTERLAAENGLEARPLPEGRQPNTLAEGLRAAAICLLGELP